MPRRRRPRLTPKKKPKPIVDKVCPNGHDAKSFATLAKDFESFVLEDSDNVRHTFKRGDVAYIRYKDEDDVVIAEEDYWIGQIEEIRAESPDDEPFARVQWFWSPQEVAEVIKSFDPTVCGKYEKLSSDNVDFISAHCFVRHVTMKAFEEYNIHQLSIGEDEWYHRYMFHYSAKRVSPKVTHEACPICRVPYTPGAEKILHFCPRPHCRKFYHQACLVKNGYVQTTRYQRVLETWPEVDRTVCLETLCGTRSSPPRKRQKLDSSPSRESITDSLPGIPKDLVAIADQQIIRGNPGGGIVGNITPVVNARLMIFRALSGRGVIPDDWENTVDISAAFPEIDDLPNCICPNCQSPI